MILWRVMKAAATAVVVSSAAIMAAPFRATAEEPRHGLVIANQSYNSRVGKLANPIGDAEKIRAALIRVGFEVPAVITDTDQVVLRKAVLRFADRVRLAGNGAVSFLYYAGHGLAVGDQNYLLPVSLPTTRKDDVQGYGVALGWIIDQLESRAPSAANYVVFDACRNVAGLRGRSRGFVAVRERQGMFIAFSTARGATAEDGEPGKGGPYAGALAYELTRSNQHDADMFYQVRLRVHDATGGQQVPWSRDGILRKPRIHFAGNSPKACSDADEKAAKRALEGAGESLDVVDLLGLIQRFPFCPSAERAKERIKELASRTGAGLQPNSGAEAGGSRVLGALSPISTRGKNVAPSRRSSKSMVPLKWVYSRAAGVLLTKSEITVAQFRACVADGGCAKKQASKSNWCNWGRSGRDKHPINCVSWLGAEAFCRWNDARLPTATEWYAEASNGGQRTYPWGPEQTTCAVMRQGGDGCQRDRTWPVCSKPKGNSVSGLCDMVGNVWEWTSSPRGSGYTILGGGFSNDTQEHLRASAILSSKPSSRDYDLGFRCARQP